MKYARNAQPKKIHVYRWHILDASDTALCVHGRNIEQAEIVIELPDDAILCKRCAYHHEKQTNPNASCWKRTKVTTEMVAVMNTLWMDGVKVKDIAKRFACAVKLCQLISIMGDGNEKDTFSIQARLRRGQTGL